MSATSTFALPAGACDCHVHFYGDPRGRHAELAGDSQPR